MAGRNATSGGSSETEVKDETAMPTGPPRASREVTAATPLGKCPRTDLNRAESMSELVSMLATYKHAYALARG
ncbi:hypothetical protein GCM10023082_28570 [Streptomyces tremellae]|uniref:Uncharacterized protein n=1 Tax=Streptomyces tremellae TaxID=1124239 RepID=A0ABP7F1C6_9ACTN